MTQAFSRLIASILAGGACLLHTGMGSAQTPEQTKMWEAQRASPRRNEKAKMERLDRAARGEKGGPHGLGTSR